MSKILLLLNDLNMDESFWSGRGRHLGRARCSIHNPECIHPLPPPSSKKRGFTYEISSGWQQANVKNGTDLILLVDRNNNNKLHNNNKKLHNNNNSSSNCSDNIDSDNNLYLLWYTSETKGCTGCRSVKLRTCSQYRLSVINKES